MVGAHPDTIARVRIAMIASECEPFAKSGGLADVVDALSRALGRNGHEVDVYLPWYRDLNPPGDLRPTELTVPVGHDPARAEATSKTGPPVRVTVWTGSADGYRLRLVEHAPSFDRSGMYGDAQGDFLDNAARYLLLGRAALEHMRSEARPPDVLHGHDWQAGPAILSLRTRYASDPLFAFTATMLTCHNLAYHGWVPRARAWQLDLPDDIGDRQGVDLLREAAMTADLVTTVSPRYAEESRTPEYGAGMDDVLRRRGDTYLGILNGIDTSLWDPATDATLAARYSAANPSGKRLCRADLCARLELDPAGPIFGLVGRLDPQKGFDLVTAAAPRMVEGGARIAVLGTGDHSLVAGLTALASSRPDRIAVLDRFDRDEARRIYAGADLFLMPSRFEPSGQGQLIALRYGTIPVVRLTGGLADTVRDANQDPESGNGFAFVPALPEALLDAASRAMAAVREPARYAAIQARGMTEDVSWARPAKQYEEAYRRALGLRRSA
jgi:starch synthase